MNHTVAGSNDGNDGVLLWLLSTTDAALWASAFMEMQRKKPDLAQDEGTMLSWFANAIEVGRSAGRREAKP